MQSLIMPQDLSGFALLSVTTPTCTLELVPWTKQVILTKNPETLLWLLLLILHTFQTVTEDQCC